MQEKHIFAGNNTSEGFFSYFDYLLKPEEANHIYILKGGPGVGKNRFMKRFAEIMEEKDIRQNIYIVPATILVLTEY